MQPGEPGFQACPAPLLVPGFQGSVATRPQAQAWLEALPAQPAAACGSGEDLWRSPCLTATCGMCVPHPLYPPPYLPSSNHLLSCIHGLTTARAPVSTSDFLRHSGCVRVGGSVGLAPVGGREFTVRAAQARWRREELWDHNSQTSFEGPGALDTTCWAPWKLQPHGCGLGGDGQHAQATGTCPIKPHPTLQTGFSGFPPRNSEAGQPTALPWADPAAGSARATQPSIASGQMLGRRCPQQPRFRKQDPNSLFVFDSQGLAPVRAQGPRALAESIALGAVLLAVAGLAVDLLSVHSDCGAVQVLLTDH